MVGPSAQHEPSPFFWLALHMAPGVGAVTFTRLLKHFKTPEAVFRASPSELARFPRMQQKTIEALARFDWSRQVEDEMARVRTRGLKLITLADPAYPARLKEISDPPPVLWVAGDIRAEDETAVALVGSRGATDYGRETATRLAGELAAAGVTVVSGMAMGIDAAAHRGALAAGGRTFGVLGCGLDVVYPSVNRDLFESAPRQGALISEFALGVKPQAGHFPVRNRVIAGLSLAVVVVEAAEKSGALITARLALEQNRDVLAVPGRVGSIKSRGAHALLKEGARLVESARDILDEIGPQVAGGMKRTPPSMAEPELTGVEKQIWDALADDPLHVDVIGRIVGMSPARLAPLLLAMEMDALIRTLPGMRYQRNLG